MVWQLGSKRHYPETCWEIRPSIFTFVHYSETYLLRVMVSTRYDGHNLEIFRFPSLIADLIPHHCMLSLIQPAHPQPILNPFIFLKHLHTHHKHIILLFLASSSHLNQTPHTSITRMGTSERHKGAQVRMTIFFLWQVMHNVQQQLNNMMSVKSPTPASWGKPTYTQ